MQAFRKLHHLFLRDGGALRNGLMLFYTAAATTTLYGSEDSTLTLDESSHLWYLHVRWLQRMARTRREPDGLWLDWH